MIEFMVGIFVLVLIIGTIAGSYPSSIIPNQSLVVKALEEARLRKFREIDQKLQRERVIVKLEKYIDMKLEEKK